MRTQGNKVVQSMLSACLAVHPVRRASIRWRCEVRVYERGMRTGIAHQPGVMQRMRGAE